MSNLYSTSVSTGHTTFYRVSIDLDSAREAEEKEYPGYKKPWGMILASINGGALKWRRAYYDGYALKVSTGNSDYAVAFETDLKKKP